MFKFRLASVLRLREHKERECKDYLAFCIKELHFAELRKKQITELIKQKEKDLTKLQTGKINLMDVIRYKEYLSFQRELLLNQSFIIEEKKKDLHQARIKLVQAMKDKKILTKLEEKQQNFYSYQENRREQAILDDLAVRK